MTSPLQEQLQRALGGEYTLERELGGGGMSRVFLATERALDRTVVIKVLPPDLSAAVSAERFRREIQLAARLQHPHIVPVLAAGTADGVPYYVMPFQAGESLRERLARDRTLPVREAASILRDVAQALAYAHAHSVVHRDIKPDNILLTGGVAMVTDFGVAKAIADAGGGGTLTSAGLALGTPAYMAPEQGAGDPGSDQRADLYALGAVAYEMLCGTTLFPGRSPQQVLVAHVVEAPHDVRECRPDAPPALAALVMRCLRKDPAQRPSSAQEVVQGVDDAMSGGGGGGHRPLRRIRLALALTAMAVIIASLVLTLRRAPSAETGRSIAVLPFENASGEQENDYFGDGMAEELINGLSKVPGLRVAARTSAFAFKGKNDDVREIGRKLNVATILEGSVRKSGTRLRVSARLVDAINGYQIWSNEYQRDATDVFGVQDELAQSIVGALQLRLGPGGGASLARRGTTNVEAYNLYLQGRYFYEKRSEDGLQRAAKFFGSAIALDSSYAAAYSGYADSYSLLGTFGFLAPRDAFPTARRAALRALALDSTIAESWTSIGFIDLFWDFDLAAGNRELTRAIEIDSTYAPARLFRSWYFVAAGQPQEAVREVQRALAEDPLSMIINTRYGTMLVWTREYERSAAQLRHALELDPTYALAHAQLARSYLGLHRCDDAMREATTAGPIVGNYESAILGYSAAVCGDTVLARAKLAELLQAAQHRFVAGDVIARLYAGLGDKSKALDWLDRAYEQRVWSLFLLKVDPAYDNLRGEPRFQSLVRQVRLP